MMKRTRTAPSRKPRIIHFATMNRDKFSEASLILNAFNIKLRQLPKKPIEVQSDDPAEIARACGEALIKQTRGPLIVEDAGLFIDALRGFPGPYSAYVHRTLGVRGILRLMEGLGNRGATFLSAVAYADGKSDVKVFVGRIHGEVTKAIRGERGFGFDPIFKPHGASKTFAEMSPAEKCIWSHRAKALRKFAHWLHRGTPFF